EACEPRCTSQPSPSSSRSIRGRRNRTTKLLRAEARTCTSFMTMIFQFARFGGASFCVSELLLCPVVMPLPHLVPLERLPQPELDFRAQRAHLPPRLGGQHLSQIILEADREATILIRVVSHRESSS